MLMRFLVCTVILAALIWPSSPAVAAGSCDDINHDPARVIINLTVPEPVYNNTQDKPDLAQKGADYKKAWAERNGLIPLWSSDNMSTEGTAAGGMSFFFDIKTDSKPFDSYKIYSCAYFTEVNVELFYRSVIFIPSEYEPGSCAYEIVREHQLKHQREGRKTVHAFTDRLRRDMPAIIKQMESGSYVRQTRIKSRTNDMEQGIMDAVKVYFQEAMASVMQEQISAIDTPEEYADRSARLIRCAAEGEPQTDVQE